MIQRRVLPIAVAAIVVASGAAALIFETLWFRLCALMLGNGVWASSLVLAGFMAGLAAGNWLSATRAARWRRPLRVYAALEAGVAISGMAVVLLLPALTRILVPWLGPALQEPVPRNVFRLLSALLVLAVPAAAMGATLPTLVRGLSSQREVFGSLLGRLYAWNTAGAVLGALAGELLLIERLGIRGTAFASAGLDLFAALGGLALSRRFPAEPEIEPEARTRGSRGLRLRFGLSAATCGAALLALEVTWFRYSTLRALSTATTFAVMLAVVLGGIALGGALAGRWCAWRPEAPSHAAAVACAAGVAVVASFAGLGEPTGPYLSSRLPEILAVALRLMLPTSLVSGVLFVLIGALLEAELRDGARAAGLLTLANTLGAMAGALLAGFVLLPALGIEGSLIAATCAYAVAGALLIPGPGAASGFRPMAAGVAALGLALWLFPLGRVGRTIRASAAVFGGETELLAVREGRLETLVYLRNQRWGRPYYDWMLTNGFSMAGTNPGNQRYMKMFAYWPLALRPDAKSALLVCFGVGNTAHAFVSVPSLASLDVVDISPDVLEMGALLYPPGASPLDDPRVRIHVEDGRFFLQITARRYDVITAEPPPPKNVGVVNLYSREYFALVRERLAGGGITTHWLPVHQLSPSDARAIVAGFCSVFPDCTLWSGRGLEFMLAGTRGLSTGPDEQGMGRLWSTATSAQQLRDIGFDSPELLGMTFLGDAEFLGEFAAAQAPLDDDHPLRLSARPQYFVDPSYARILDAAAARARFEASPWVKRLWPEALRERTLESFWIQEIVNRLLGGNTQRLADVSRVLRETRIESLPLLLLDSSPLEVRLAEDATARRHPDPAIPYVLGLGALATRDWSRAEALFAEAQQRGAAVSDLGEARAFVAAMAQGRAAP